MTLARLEANCDEYVYELFASNIVTNNELIFAVSYTIGRIEERGRTVPYWYEEYGHDLVCRLIALYRTGELTVVTMVQPVCRDLMLSFLLEEQKHPSKKVMNEFNTLRQTL